MSGIALDYAYAAVAGVFGAASGRGSALGTNPNIDTASTPEDVWAGAELGILNGIDHRLIPRPQNVAVPMELVSSSDNDTLAGTGARTVTAFYLDSLYVAKIFTANMNGQTAVPFPENVMRINGLVVGSSGTFGGTNIGNISARHAGGLGATYAYMAAGVSMSRSSMFTVPAANSYDLLSVFLGVSRANADRWATFSLCFQTNTGRLLKGIELPASSTVPYRHEAQNAPITVIAEKTDVWWRCETVSQNSTSTTAGIFGVTRPGPPFSGPYGVGSE